MSLTIVGANTPASLNFQQILINNRKASKVLRELSSGKRINTLEDDASGYSVARGLESHRRGIEQALRNLGTAENVLGVAGNSYEVIVNSLVKIKELVIQGADDRNSNVQRDAIQLFISKIINEIDSIVDQATFQGVKLIDGTYTGKKFQTGGSSENVLEVSLGAADSTTLNLSAIDVSSNAAATASLQVVDDAIQSVQEQLETTGQFVQRIQFKISNMRTLSASTEATRSRIEDADFADAQRNYTRYQILQQVGTTALNQSIAAPQLVLTLIR
jgi:flagellin